MKYIYDMSSDINIVSHYFLCEHVLYKLVYTLRTH